MYLLANLFFKFPSHLFGNSYCNIDICIALNYLLTFVYSIQHWQSLHLRFLFLHRNIKQYFEISVFSWISLFLLFLYWVCQKWNINIKICWFSLLSVPGESVFPYFQYFTTIAIVVTIFEEHLWESASVSIKMLLIVRFAGNLEVTLGDDIRQKNI